MLYLRVRALPLKTYMYILMLKVGFSPKIKVARV